MVLPSIEAIELEQFYRRHETRTLTGTVAEKYTYGKTRISIVPKLRPIFDFRKEEWKDVEFFGLKGGRGGAKSESVGELLTLIAREEKTRILCTREIQNAIKDSVKKVIEDWIDKLGLQHEFTITGESIVHKVTGTDFVFMGLKSGTDTASVKSLKGVKYVWVEEAQTLSKASWDMLRPTIRIDGRKFFFTYNPRTERDVVDDIRNRRKAHFITINYIDNPFLPQNMLDDAIEDKETNYDWYMHIWEGQPMAEDAASIILPYSQLTKCVDLHKLYGFDEGQMFAGLDIAVGQHDHHDKNSFAARAAATVHKVEEWRIGEPYESVRKVHGWYYEMGFSEVNFDAIGVGAAIKSEYARIKAEESKKEDGFKIPYDTIPVQGSMAPRGGDICFTKQGRNVILNKDYFKDVKSQLWWNLRLRLQNSMKLIEGKELDRQGYYLSFSSGISELDSLFSELSQATHKIDGGGRILVDKSPGIKEIRVEGRVKRVKSPNKADSTLLSFARDLEYGLRAHGDEEFIIEDELVIEPITEWPM